MPVTEIDGKDYDLKDHKLCALGHVVNCSECIYLTGCCRGYEGHEVGSRYRDMQTFKLTNPNI